MENKKINFVENFQKSAFKDDIEESVQKIRKSIQELYLSDEAPWIIGYSGGKDSTACVQLVWEAISELPEDQRLSKKIHVISTDTLVENPAVAMWVEVSLKKMELAAHEKKMPIYPKRLVPELKDRFWVNLIGKGYPAPRPMFRWCTSRLKINPSNNFISTLATENGEAILVLGTRKAESSARKKSMENHEGSTRDLLSRNGDPKLDRVWIYPPIVDWSNDDVWEYLVTYKNPWDFPNKQLLDMYRGATADNECPLVVDTSTPSCGDSRFGCFVCTLVEKDKSMEAMINNNSDKKWMSHLSEFRNKYLDFKNTNNPSQNDFERRDFRRMDGRLTLMNDPEKGGKKLVHGPYLQSYREEMLHALLVAQEKVRDSGEPGTEAYQVITDEELEEIRRIWVVEKNEIEDRVPEIYKNATNRQYPYDQIDDSRIFNRTDLELLKNIASPNNSIDDLHYQLVRNLLNVERNYSTAIKRVGIYENLEKILINNGFTDGKEALAYAIDKESSILEDKDRYPGYFHANQMDDDVEPFVTELNNNQSNGEINAP